MSISGRDAADGGAHMSQAEQILAENGSFVGRGSRIARTLGVEDLR